MKAILIKSIRYRIGSEAKIIPVGTKFEIIHLGEKGHYSHTKGLDGNQVWPDEFELFHEDNRKEELNIQIAKAKRDLNIQLARHTSSEQLIRIYQDDIVKLLAELKKLDA